jgi:hypothetical protein
VIDELPTAHRPQAVRSLSIAENDHQDTKMKSWAAKKNEVKFLSSSTDLPVDQVSRVLHICDEEITYPRRREITAGPVMGVLYSIADTACYTLGTVHDQTEDPSSG